MAVQEYLDKHNLSAKIEEGVNEVVKTKPEEPLSHLVGSTLSLPPMHILLGTHQRLCRRLRPLSCKPSAFGAAG